MLDPDYSRAAQLIAGADGLLVTAGAGMGVDSGLPDFRGRQGFWQAYPALALAGLEFQAIASPAAFRSNPRLAWGFYGHRLKLYRRTVPHDGFRILQKWAAAMSNGAFVATTNVDGQFQIAGFPENRLYEAHGSIHHLQCLDACTDSLWPAADITPDVDDVRCLLLNDLPACPYCGGLARPAILMFMDSTWRDVRERIQAHAFRQWRQKTEHGVVIELGAGTAIPTARMIGEQTGFPLIRINPREGQVSRQTDVGLPVGALEGLLGIAAELANHKSAQTGPDSPFRTNMSA